MNNQAKNTVPKSTKMRKLPEIKQTKTSLLRLLKTNPLLETEVMNKTIQNKSKQAEKLPQNISRKDISKVCENKMSKQVSKVPQNKDPKENSKLCERKELKSILKTTEKKPQQRRRSLSAQHFESKKGIQFNKRVSKLNRVQSIDNITISPVQEERASTRKSVFEYKCANDMDNLKQGLNNWLKKRGKSLISYPHLKCFNIKCDNEIINEENKENIEVLCEKSESYENLSIKPIKGSTVNENLENVASSALEDINKLVHEGYSSDQCEKWLNLIQNKFENVVNQASYWECRASIEQARGNFAQAVDCYENAIVQGAEVENISESLDDLLKKFSLFNISPRPENDNKERTRIVREAKNIFKSSIIQFAIQKKKSIKSECASLDVNPKFIATPIRRSTRLSRSAYTSTPGLLVCSSLRDLSPDFQKNLDFQKNNALL